MRKILIFTFVFGAAIVLLAISAAGQTLPEFVLLQASNGQAFSTESNAPFSPGSEQSDRPIDMAGAHTPQSGATAEPTQNATQTATALAIRPGTRILAVLTSPLHSTSGTQGSGVYLEVLVPIIQGDRVVIPAHSYIQGTMEGNRRPGHLKRTSEFRFRFTSIIFPNNHVEPMDAVLQSIPGSKTTRARPGEGALQTVDQPEKVLIPGAGGAVTGGVVGSVSRLGIGTYIGAGLGAGLGLVAVLLHRGDDIDLPLGTRIEMVLRSEISLTSAQQEFNSKYIAPPPTTFPAPPIVVHQQQRRRHHESGLLLPLLGAILLR